MVLVIPRINIKKITQKHTKRKMRRVSKVHNDKRSIKHKGRSGGNGEGKAIRHRKKKIAKCLSKFFIIRNKFKCKQSKLSNQKA